MRPDYFVKSKPIDCEALTESFKEFLSTLSSLQQALIIHEDRFEAQLINECNYVVQESECLPLFSTYEQINEFQKQTIALQLSLFHKWATETTVQLDLTDARCLECHKYFNSYDPNSSNRFCSSECREIDEKWVNDFNNRLEKKINLIKERVND